MVGLFILLISIAFGADTDFCLDVFRKSKVEPRSENCPVNCTAAALNALALQCNERCPKYCGQKVKCKAKPQWIKKILPGRPPGWPIEKEVPIQLSDAQKQMIESALAELSQFFPVESLKGIFALDKARAPFSSGTPSTYFEGTLVFYSRAFTGAENVKRLLLHELAHHLHETKERKLFEAFKARLNDKGDAEEQFAKRLEEIWMSDESNGDQIDFLRKNVKPKYFVKECKK